MAKISRDSEVVELDGPPAFQYGERVVSRHNVRNDGTFGGRDVGDLLVAKGDVGYVTSIGTFLQQYYIYGIEFVEHGYKVGMRERELMSLDHLPPEVLERLGSEQRAQLARLGRPERSGAEASPASVATLSIHP